MDDRLSRRRRALLAVGVLAALAWGWSVARPAGVEERGISRPVPDGGPVRPVPTMESWRAVEGAMPGEGALRVYLSDESPEAAAVRAAGRFRAAGWTPLAVTPAGGSEPHLLAFRSGGAVCWILTEADPRTGRTRCVTAGP
jgi:hypothetical protein